MEMYRTDEQHPAKSLSGMAALRKEGKLCDVVIKVGEKQFHAHKVILAGSSSYFQAMFTGSLEESKMGVVTIRDIPSHTMETLLDYCYTSTIAITEDNVQDLLPSAGILQLNWVREVCCEFMKHQLHTSNCLGIRSFADTHSCVDLEEAADRYAQQHYLEVLDSTEFSELSCEDLAKLLESEDLNVQSEEQVFESVMKWVRHDIDNRKQLLPKVLKHVRLPLLERSYLVSKVGLEPLIRHNEECRDLVDEAKDYLLLPELRAKLQGPRTRPRRPMTCDEVLFAVGGWCSGDAISLVERYNAHTDEWKVAATMSKRRCGVGVAVLGEFLYAIGGHDGSSYLNSVERYDPKTNHWSSSIPPTSSCRTSVGVGVLDGCIYAVGGQDGVSCLSIVEKYDPAINQWCQVSSMTTKRLGVAVAVLEGQLYAVGGSDGNTPLSTVERYDQVSKQWAVVAAMSSERKHLGVAALGGLLYAVGGRDQTTELNTVESYNPATDNWSVVVAMNSRRSGVALSVANGKLYAVGGFDGCTYLKSMECFEPATNQWRPAGNMNYRRLGCGVGVLKLTTAAI